MSDTFLTERARIVAERLAQARCWHQSPTSFGTGISTKWFDLNAADVEEAVIRLRELAQGIEAAQPPRREAGLAREGESPVPEGNAP